MEKKESLAERIRKNTRHKGLVITTLVLLWINVVLGTLLMYRNSLGKISSGNEAYDNIVELVRGSKVVETVGVVDDCDALAIKLATYARRNSGKFVVTVVGNDTHKVYAAKEYDVRTIQDNAFMTVELNEPLDSSIDETINITLKSEASSGNAIGVYYSNEQAYENSILTIGDEVTEGDLSVRFLNDSEEMQKFYHLIITWVIATFTLILLLLLFIRPKYEILFLMMGIAFGLTFWLIITPMSVPDETIHYEYSFQLSNYIMRTEDHMVFNEEYQNYGAMAGHLNISAAYERFIKKINKPLSLRENDAVMRFDINESYKICFIPQALGITVSRLLKWNMLRTFYLGRLFNLIFYLVCLYTAIKKTPVHKVLFGIIATLPIFMQQAASFSYDCFINGLTFVIIAYLLKWMHQEEPISIKEFILAFIANLMIAPIKVVYGLFTLMYWFVPARNYGSKKKKILMTLIITFPAMFELVRLLGPLTMRVFKQIFRAITGQIAGSAYHLLKAETEIQTDILEPFRVDGEVYTFDDVLTKPLEMIELFLRTVRYSIKTWFYAAFGRALSGNTLILPTWIVHSLLAVLIASSIIQEKQCESLSFKIVTFLLCIFGGLMMVGGMLISWTEVEQIVIEDYGGPIIQGIQGRYFSPFLPYLFIILHNPKFNINKKFEPYIIYIFILLVYEVIVYVLSYTFMN
ncbi:MAG: DUF2142 domain-containing protein [Erysipelotrichaceae bacterium]|nr:DUF2142 domain-containing protein [Erysipelotrichaceae bacterium]